MTLRTRFRPCIDLHAGKVKQIVGGTLDSESESLRTNFVSDRPASWFAEKYCQDGLEGGHIIKLGPGNDEAALSALQAYPRGMQLGGGITAENAADWLENGASHVIATSYIFNKEGKFQESLLATLQAATGRERLVLDLSCRRTESGWTVAMNRWQTYTDLDVSRNTLGFLAAHCAEFLVHAADVEGKCEGIDTELVEKLAEWSEIPVTYAGGARNLADLQAVQELSQGKVDLTIGSALDIFGGSGVTYAECLAFNRDA